jgi:phosphoglucomutase
MPDVPMVGRPIEDLAQEWLSIDHDPTTRQEIQDLLTTKNNAELEKRLREPLAFGTAGLRAKMEAGFSRMNSLTVIQASQGLAEYLLATIPNTKTRGVVIGRDARHNSKKFAQLTAAAFVTKNIKVWWFEIPVHTPLVPFGVREFHAAAGVMITASHNPAQDNGYKVYWENGCQIIPPHDVGIAEAIKRNKEPLSWDKRIAEHSLLVEGSLGPIEEKYFQALVAAVDPSESLRHVKDERMRFTYTAMHGVGLRFMEHAAKVLCVEDYLNVVQEQAHPDPNFPGLDFPNPEEKGALEAATCSADRNDVSLVLATDPDADRLAVAEKVSGVWHQFSGNQLGILLASHVFETYAWDKKKLAMIASTVSSTMLSVMAEHEGFHFAETLTGFKWIGNKALELDAAGYDSRFGFEESIGYMIPGLVKDKDGIAAASLFLAAVARWRKQGHSPWEVLQHLCKKYGHFEEANTYLISPSPAITSMVFSSIRALGTPFPKSLGSHKVHNWRDLTRGWDSRTADHKPLLPVDHASQMITCELDGHVRLTIRASGTEPKIKVYIECHCHHRDDARKGADETLGALWKEWLKPETHGLKAAGA